MTSSTGGTRRADGSYSRGWRGLTTIVLPPLLYALMKHDWRGKENIRNIPPDSGLILAVNHLSYADVLAICLFSYKSGRYPVFLAKSSLFEMKGLGAVMRGTGQLPVYRGQADAALVLRDAERGLKNGACVIFYPEATATRDPDLWPMAAKTGVARLALTTGVPVIPVAQWGTQDILPYGTKKLSVIPRHMVKMQAGPPVDLSGYEGEPLNRDVLRAATATIMADITGLLARLRGGTPPEVPYHPAVARRAARQAAREATQDDPDGQDRDPAAAADPAPGTQGGDEPQEATPA